MADKEPTSGNGISKEDPVIKRLDQILDIVEALQFSVDEIMERISDLEADNNPGFDVFQS